MVILSRPLISFRERRPWESNAQSERQIFFAVFRTPSLTKACKKKLSIPDPDSLTSGAERPLIIFFSSGSGRNFGVRSAIFKRAKKLCEIEINEISQFTHPKMPEKSAPPQISAYISRCSSSHSYVSKKSPTSSENMHNSPAFHCASPYHTIYRFYRLFLCNIYHHQIHMPRR